MGALARGAPAREIERVCQETAASPPPARDSDLAIDDWVSRDLDDAGYPILGCRPVRTSHQIRRRYVNRCWPTEPLLCLAM
jgi:hypothetical protein